MRQASSPTDLDTFMAKMLGDVGAAMSLEVTQNKRGPVLLGQPVDFLTQDLLNFAPRQVAPRFRGTIRNTHKEG